MSSRIPKRSPFVLSCEKMFVFPSLSDFVTACPCLFVWESQTGLSGWVCRWVSAYRSEFPTVSLIPFLYRMACRSRFALGTLFETVSDPTSRCWSRFECQCDFLSQCLYETPCATLRPCWKASSYWTVFQGPLPSWWSSG